MNSDVVGKAEPTLRDVLERASTGNEIIVTHSDGNIYAIRKISESGESPFDRLGIPTINLKMSIDEIVQIVREGRRRAWDPATMSYEDDLLLGDDVKEESD